VVALTARRAPVPIFPGDPGVSAALRAWRTEKAKKEGKPPYIYLTDALVEAIATRWPSTLFELRALPGIGPKKLDEYGEDLLAVIRDAAEPPAEATIASRSVLRASAWRATSVAKSRTR
jgi:superfamily II DNA helicase RecQ